VTVSGSTIEVSDVQFQNTQRPILVTPSGMTIEVRDSQ